MFKKELIFIANEIPKGLARKNFNASLNRQCKYIALNQAPAFDFKKGMDIVTNVSNGTLYAELSKVTLPKDLNIYRLNYGAIPFPSLRDRIAALTVFEALSWLFNYTLAFLLAKYAFKRFSNVHKRKIKNLFDYGSMHLAGMRVKNLEGIIFDGLGSVSKKNKQVVFVDQDLLHHPDNLYRGWRLNQLDYHAYMKLVIDRYRGMGFYVVCAAHPSRKNFQDLEDLHFDEIKSGDTYDLIAESEIVLGIFSTTLKYAILLRKPIIFLCPVTQIEPYVKAYSSALGQGYLLDPSSAEFELKKQSQYEREKFISEWM